MLISSKWGRKAGGKQRCDNTRCWKTPTPHEDTQSQNHNTSWPLVHLLSLRDQLCSQIQKKNVNTTCWDARLVPVCLSLDGAKNELGWTRVSGERGKCPSCRGDHETNELELFNFRWQKTHFWVPWVKHLQVSGTSPQVSLSCSPKPLLLFGASTVLRCSYRQLKPE